MDEQPLPDLFRVMAMPAPMRELLFHDPDGYMAKMIIADEPDDERRMAGYQAMTVLARLVWERPYDPKLPAACTASSARRCCCGATTIAWSRPPTRAAYKKHLPQAELQLIPNCGHMGMFEKEAEFVEAIRRFALAQQATTAGETA